MISATATKKNASTSSIGTTNRVGSAVLYSVPKNTSCGDCWLPTRTTDARFVCPALISWATAIAINRITGVVASRW